MKNVKMILLAAALLFVGQSVGAMEVVPSEGADAEEVQCPICFIVPSGLGVIYHLANTDGSIGCQKRFHKACIDMALKFKKACPVCRGGVTAECFVSDDAASEDDDLGYLEAMQASKSYPKTDHRMGAAPRADYAMGDAVQEPLSEEEMLAMAMHESMSKPQDDDHDLEAAIAASLEAEGLDRYRFPDAEALPRGYAASGQGMGSVAYHGYPGGGAGGYSPLPLPSAPPMVDEEDQLAAAIAASLADAPSMPVRVRYPELPPSPPVSEDEKELAQPAPQAAAPDLEALRRARLAHFTK